MASTNGLLSPEVLRRAKKKGASNKLQAASFKPQATSNKPRATSIKRQAASGKLPNSFFLIKFPVSRNERLYQDKCIVRMLNMEAIWCGENLKILRLVTLSSTVKKCLFLLYPSRSGTPGSAIFSSLVHVISGVFF